MIILRKLQYLVFSRLIAGTSQISVNASSPKRSIKSIPKFLLGLCSLYQGYVERIAMLD